MPDTSIIEKEHKDFDPIYIIAALLKAAGGEVEVTAEDLSGVSLSGKAIEMEERVERDTINFKLVSVEEK